VLPAADVAVSISAASGKSSGNPLKVNPKQSLTYTVVVINGGPNSADGVALQDILPDSFAFESATTTQGTLLAPSSGATGTLTARLGTLTGHGSATVRITGSFRLRKALVPNTVSVTASATDPNLANNQATTNVTVN
jgi:large repetitive protein